MLLILCGFLYHYASPNQIFGSLENAHEDIVSSARISLYTNVSKSKSMLYELIEKSNKIDFLHVNESLLICEPENCLKETIIVFLSFQGIKLNFKITNLFTL